MAAIMGEALKNCKEKLSHKQFKRLIQKEKRRIKRQAAAIEKQEEEIIERKRTEEESEYKLRLEHEEKEENERRQAEEMKRLVQHELWLQREKKAQEEFEKMKRDEEKRLQERLDQESRIKEEWETQQKLENQEKNRKEQHAKEKEDELRKEMENTPQTDDASWHNPIAPPSELYGTEQDKSNCSFYLKTGACRFGERCSRMHVRPNHSVTLMIPGMYVDITLQQDMLDEADHDTGLEYDDHEAYERFASFANDVLSEFEKAGKLVQFKVCCNHEPHLRGNVFVQYASEEECAEAFALFNGRWYAQKQLSCEFSPVTNWKSAICGLFQRGVCSRGKNCNFLHVYRDPPGLRRRLHQLSSPTRTWHSTRDWRKYDESDRRGSKRYYDKRRHDEDRESRYRERSERRHRRDRDHREDRNEHYKSREEWREKSSERTSEQRISGRDEEDRFCGNGRRDREDEKMRIRDDDRVSRYKLAENDERRDRKWNERKRKREGNIQRSHKDKFGRDVDNSQHSRNQKDQFGRDIEQQRRNSDKYDIYKDEERHRRSLSRKSQSSNSDSDNDLLKESRGNKKHEHRLKRSHFLKKSYNSPDSECESDSVNGKERFISSKSNDHKEDEPHRKTDHIDACDKRYDDDDKNVGLHQCYDNGMHSKSHKKHKKHRSHHKQTRRKRRHKRQRTYSSTSSESEVAKVDHFASPSNQSE